MTQVIRFCFLLKPLIYIGLDMKVTCIISWANNLIGLGNTRHSKIIFYIKVADTYILAQHNFDRGVFGIKLKTMVSRTDL